MTSFQTPLNRFVPSVKEWYWVPHPSKVWITVLVKKVIGDTCWVTTSDSIAEFELSLTDCPFLCLNPRVVGDMASLLHLHEPGILHNLCERASPQNQHPYTYVSTVLIVVNPLRPVLMPSMKEYKDIPMGAASPNPYGIAEMAYKNLTAFTNQRIRNQSIVISGESGAGKTETAKIVLRYLCWRASSTVRWEGEDKCSAGTPCLGVASSVSLDKKLLDTNPVLEAFGNAKTFRNSNSSRFGKLLKLNFDSKRSFCLVSASIDTYLLEKSRVTSFPVGERNYHIFYQLLKGAGSLERKRWFLKDSSDYAYLNFGQSKEIEEVDDRADFSKLTSSLLSVGINIIQQDLIFRVLSAILYLGNVSFTAVEGPSGEEAQLLDVKLAARVSELLGVRKQNIESILTSRSLDMAGAGGRTSSYRIPLDVKQASYARDAVAKSVYNTVFHWIIKQIQFSLQSDEEALFPNYIGVLDIFGFESFEKNGLEQLLINYANESLQLIFNKAVLDAEQEMYVEEGFMLAPIDYVNNNNCVNLIAMGRDSILISLDSVCKAPEPTEEKFNSLIHKTHSKNSHFLKPEMKNMRTTFKIKHYAKAVHYTIGTFIAKNMDSCPAELTGLLASSSHSSRCTLFSFDADLENCEMEGGDALPHHQQTSSRSLSGTKIRKQHVTMSKKFKTQMSSLSDLLTSTNCTFIRCIKPNHTMTPGLFEHRFVMDQVRSLGVVQTCEVLRQGLPARVQFVEIESMYRNLFIDTNMILTQNLSGKDFTEAILWALNISKSAYKLGKSRVFFNLKSLSDMNRLLNSFQDAALVSTLVKRVVRFVHLQRWRKVLAAGLSYFVFLELLKSCRHRNQASICIQSKWKSYALSNLRAKKIRNRRRWKIAICYTMACNQFLSNYKLICEARDMRIKAEKIAQMKIEESLNAELRQQQLIDEMALSKGVDTTIATRSCAKKIRSTLNLGQRNSTLLNAQDLSENENIFRDSKELEAALMEQQIDKSKSEMKKLAAASSLATVSVALFRWTKIKKFRAFEKWFEFYKVGEPMVKSNELDESEIIQLKSSRLERGVDNLENLVQSDGNYLCFECKDRTAKVWCHDCNQPYCLVCSQFVHNSCSFMRYHRPLNIESRPSPENILLLNTPMEPLSSFVAAGTMKAMVNAILYSESNLQNSNSSISKMLYYSNICNDVNMEGIGNQASVLLDRVHEELVEEPAFEKLGSQNSQIIFSGSGGLLHTEDETQHCAIRSCDIPASKGISIRFCAAHYDEFRSATRRISDSDENSLEESDANSLQQQVALLKKQLIDSGQQPVEFVELSVARALMQAAVERLMSGDEGAEAEIEKWDKAIRLNPEYQAEMLEKARKWEEDEKPANVACLRQMRRIVPVDVRQITTSCMQERGLPKKIAQRIWSKKILWFLSTHPEDIGKIHVADLRTKYSYIGLDIVEMRAIYAALPDSFENDGDGKKKEWRDSFRQKLEEFTLKEAGNRLTNPEKRNFAYKGHEHLELFDPDVPVPRAQLLKSDAFGPTDVSQIAELSGVGGVKDKQHKMMSRSDQPASHIENSEDDTSDIERNPHEQGNLKERNNISNSRKIAESALAADEQKRAEARGSLITVTSNPLVDPKSLAALQRPTDEDMDLSMREESASALDGGVHSIQQTILKMELAKKHKNEKNKLDDDKEDEAKKHFSDHFIAKGVRSSGGSKPFGGGRGRGGRSTHRHTGGGNTTRESGVEDSRDSRCSDWLTDDNMQPDDTKEEQGNTHSSVQLTLNRDSSVNNINNLDLEQAEFEDIAKHNDSTATSNESSAFSKGSLECDQNFTNEENCSTLDRVENMDMLVIENGLHVGCEEVNGLSDDINDCEEEKCNDDEDTAPRGPGAENKYALKESHSDHHTSLTISEEIKGDLSLEYESTLSSSSSKRDSSFAENSTCDEVKKVNSSEVANVDVNATLMSNSGLNDDEFSEIVIKRREKSDIPKKKGLWSMIKKR